MVTSMLVMWPRNKLGPLSAHQPRVRFSVREIILLPFSFQREDPESTGGPTKEVVLFAALGAVSWFETTQR
jgi:hypothetical protein